MIIASKLFRDGFVFTRLDLVEELTWGVFKIVFCRNERDPFSVKEDVKESCSLSAHD